MKKLILFSLIFISSCGKQNAIIPERDVSIPLSLYLDENDQSPAHLIETKIQNETPVVLVGARGIQSDLELLKYLVPVLADLDSLNLGLWFLNGIPADSLNLFFNHSESDLTARDLLFMSNPAQTGYAEYADFLNYLKNFIRKLPEGTSWNISGTDSTVPSALSYLSWDQRDSEILKEDNSYTIFLHNPIIPIEGKSELPFQGELYYLMITEWQLHQYSGIDLEYSPFGELYLTSQDRENNQPVKERFNGLILCGIQESLTPVRLIEDFINEGNAAEALAAFPDQFIRKKLKPASYIMNLKLRSEDKKRRKILARFSKILSDYYPSEE